MEDLVSVIVPVYNIEVRYPNALENCLSSIQNQTYKNIEVILVDDVITRGRTFCQTADKLMQNGASSVVGLFVAKTVNPDWNTSAA